MDGETGYVEREVEADQPAAASVGDPDEDVLNESLAGENRQPMLGGVGLEEVNLRGRERGRLDQEPLPGDAIAPSDL